MNYNSIFLKHENNACLGLEDGRCGLVLLAFLLSEKNEKYKETGLLHLNYLLKHVYESSCTYSGAYPFTFRQLIRV